MGRGESGSPTGEPNRGAGSFPGMPEAAAVSAALFLYSPLGSSPAYALPAFASGAALCAAGIALRASIGRRGVIRPCPSNAAFPLRKKAAHFANACLIAAAIGAGILWGAMIGTQRRAADARWQGMPPRAVTAFSGRLACDSRESSSGAALYDIELEEVESEFLRAQAKGRISLLAEGGARLGAGERLRVRAPLPEEGKLAFCDSKDLQRLGFSSAFEEMRAKAREGFIASVSRIRSRGTPLLVALMTGDKSGLSKREEEAFKLSGCAHILALSGQHIGILAALLGFLLVPLLGKRASLILSSAIVVIYLVVTGIQPSMLRSVLSYLIATAAWFLARRPRSTSVLAWTFLIAAGLQPESLQSASFCLSYGATAGIILFQERIGSFLSKWLPPSIAKALGVSLAACAASAPLSIALFGTFNPACVPVSTASGPLVSLLMWIGCAGSLVCALLPFPATGRAVGLLLEIPYRLLRAMVDWGASLSGLDFPPGSARCVACAVLASLLLLLYAWKLHGPPRIRFTKGTKEIHGRARLRHAEEVRAELPGLAERASQDRLAG
jgi:ComEC/Rec2-related protein